MFCAVKNIYNHAYLSESEASALFDELRQLEPQHMLYRGKPVKSRPKLNFGDRDDDGCFPLYQWGQQHISYLEINQTPECINAVRTQLERDFADILKLDIKMSCIVTFYHNGNDQYIPVHQDKIVSTYSKPGRIETGTPIFALSLGATREFYITDLSCLGAKVKDDFSVVERFLVKHGDLCVMTGKQNENYGHGIPKDKSVTDLRISIVFRQVNLARVNPELRYFIDKKGKRVDV
jgi:alkylated DNA repair dioxygenase AlkB